MFNKWLSSDKAASWGKVIVVSDIRKLHQSSDLNLYSLWAIINHLAGSTKLGGDYRLLLFC